MSNTYLYILMAAVCVSTFSACKKNENLPVGSNYTRDICGKHSFHYTISGYTYSGITHTPYTNTRDTVMNVDYIDDSHILFNGTKFRYDVAPSDSVISFKNEFPDSHTLRYDVTYNRMTHEVSIYRDYYISAGGGTTIESWISY